MIITILIIILNASKWILAIYAFTFLCARDFLSIAFAIFSKTRRFFTSAARCYFFKLFIIIKIIKIIIIVVIVYIKIISIIL